MTNVLCKWLNEELRLSKAVDPKTFAKDFSNGYLIGEVLHKYHLQNDFSMFTKKETSISRQNNFTRVEPTLRLLGISFNIDTARDVMLEKQGVASHLLYQIYVSLEKGKNAEIGSKLMETKEHEVYSHRPHHVGKQEAGLKLHNITQHQHLSDNFARTQQKRQDEKRMKINEKVPKPPPYTSQLKLRRRQQQQQRREQQVQSVKAEINQFEMRKTTYGYTSSSSGQPIPGDVLIGGTSLNGAKLTLQSNSKYIQDIRQLEENAVAREQRAKRRDRFLVQQLKAHEALEEAQREEQLVKRLTRQTQQEQRLEAQLLQIRTHKDLILKNRLFREQQYQQRRDRDFLEALEREAALAQQAKLDLAEEIRQELELCSRNAAERAQTTYRKHFKNCRDILEQIVDLATKVGESRLLTGKLIPEKLLREWKELLFSGLPLYEPTQSQQASLDPVELKKQDTLNTLDYDEYTNMVGEWAWPEEAGASCSSPPTNNNILGHVVHRLRSVVHQPFVKSPTVSLPPFTVKACVLGKPSSGKTTCLAKLARAHDIIVLSADSLIEEALNAHQNREASTRAMQGAAADIEMRKGLAIPNKLLVDIMVEAIRQLPAKSGWILDGLPTDINQAHLLEEALGGSVDEGNDSESSRMDLAADPNPPKPPPPPPPALDLALLLDMPDESVIRRLLSQRDADNDAATTSPTTEETLHLAQISQRITAFEDTWPELENWFGGKQKILVRIDADVDEEELHKRVETLLQQVMKQTQQALSEDVALDGEKALATPPPVDRPQGLTDRATESLSSLDKEKAQSVKSLSKSDTHSPRGQSEQVSASSVTNEHLSPESASPGPGSSCWVYVDEPLPLEIPEFLCRHWDAVCDSYVNNVKTVMQQLRSQRTFIDGHLFNIREQFKHYLGRPDLKQELVSHWQKDFNSIPEDMREDEDTKAELHRRLDDLRERLWDISDKRKEEDEKEKAALWGDGWLEEQTTVLANHHSLLTQIELDRFQDTLCILSVYYASMCRPVLPELPSMSVCIPLLDTMETTNPDERSPGSKAKDQVQTKDVKPPDEKLTSDYEEAMTAISKLVSAEAHLGETKEQKEPEGKRAKASASANKQAKRKESSKPQKGSSSPTQPEKTLNQENRDKIQKERTAVLDQEENGTKGRIALIKAHGLVKVKSLQSRAQQTRSSMEKLLEAYYLAEMKSIDQLSKVVRHHIEASVQLQNELVVDCTDFYLNGDLLMVAERAPPSRPPPVEKHMGSTPTVAQLESLHRQLYSIAPSGLMSSSDFSSFLLVTTSVHLGRNTLPEHWINKNETQLTEVVSLFTDDSELVDWRRFLLSAALPWPFPSLSQLLAVLQRFKAADSGDTGYINEKQYLQTELWFPNDSVQSVPEDPAEPLPYDRLANLRKFFFQLFADHSVSPPRVDYVCMLQYFAADPNPKLGLIRALSVVQGQHLKHSFPGRLVKSMPSIDEATELSSSDLDGVHEEDNSLSALSSGSGEQLVSLLSLHAVTCHKVSTIKDNSQQEHTELLERVFRELGYKPEDSVPFSILSQHPFILSLMETSTCFKLVNIHRVLLAHEDGGETNSL